MSIFTRLRKMRRHLVNALRGYVALPLQVRDVSDMIRYQQSLALQENHKNPLNRYGRRCFSQTDEDGITLEILKRLDLLNEGVYAEFGVGNGTENNTLILAALGWRGFWVGGEPLGFEVDPVKAKGFAFLRNWITLENIQKLTDDGLSRIGSESIDVVSLDLDGNDIYLTESLLEGGVRPALFIVEYNAKFPPEVQFRMPYDPHHVWHGDDYFGASLASFCRVFEKHGYRLVCCNAATGSNAFFVDRRFAQCFDDVPDDIHSLYVEPRYWLYNRLGHPVSGRTAQAIIERRTL